MTDLTTPTARPTCEWETGTGDVRPLCGKPASDVVDVAAAGCNVCPEHLESALAEGWHHAGSLTGGVTTYPAGDALVRRADAIVGAMTGVKGTQDEKARHIVDNLEANGWHLLNVADGPPTNLGPNEQVVVVPDGHVVDVHPAGEYTLHGLASQVDPELDLMTVVAQHLRRIGPDAAARCVDYWANRFNPDTPGGWVDITPQVLRAATQTGPAPRWAGPGGDAGHLTTEPG